MNKACIYIYIYNYIYVYIYIYIYTYPYISHVSPSQTGQTGSLPQARQARQVAMTPASSAQISSAQQKIDAEAAFLTLKTRAELSPSGSQHSGNSVCPEEELEVQEKSEERFWRQRIAAVLWPVFLHMYIYIYIIIYI